MLPPPTVACGVPFALQRGVYNYVKRVALFPGLLRFFCSSVSVDNNTWMRKGGETFSPPFRIRVLLSFAALPHPCIIVNGNQRTEKTG